MSAGTKVIIPTITPRWRLLF